MFRPDYGGQRKAALIQNYPPGTRVQLNFMAGGEPGMLPGLRGTVQFIDDAPQLHLRWDNGRSLALIPEADSFRKLMPDKNAAENAEQNHVNGLNLL